MRELDSNDFVSAFGVQRIRFTRSYDPTASSDIAIGCYYCNFFGSPISGSYNGISFGFEIPRSVKVISARSRIIFQGVLSICDSGATSKASNVVITVNGKDATSAMGGPFVVDNTLTPNNFDTTALINFLKSGENIITFTGNNSCPVLDDVTLGFVTIIINLYYIATANV